MEKVGQKESKFSIEENLRFIIFLTNSEHMWSQVTFVFANVI